MLQTSEKIRVRLRGQMIHFYSAYWVILHAFCPLLIFFSKKLFRNTIRVPNNLDPDQAQYFVGTDLGSNCLQRLSADGTSRQRVLRYNGSHSDTFSSKIFVY